MVQCLDGKNIEPRTTIDEGLGDEDIADDGEQSIGRALAVAAHLSWSDELKVMVHLDHLSGRAALSLRRVAFTSRANCLKIH